MGQQFVGGPEDGKRVALQTAPGRSYKVAMLPRLPTYVPVEENIAPVSFEQFVYEIDKLPGDLNFVAYPQSWKDDYRHTPYEQIMTALLRGYVGRGL